MENDYTVAMVFSNWTLSKIFEFCKDYIDSSDEDIGLTKIERFKDKRTGEMRDSNRTIILMKKKIFEKAIEAGLDMPQPNLDFRIDEYRLREKNFPALGYTSNFYIIIPKNIDYTEAEFCIKEKLRNIVSFGMLKPEDFSLKIPLASRITGEHRGFAYLSFVTEIDINIKAYIKALLHDCFMYISSIDKLYHLPVFWAKDSKALPPVPKIIKILKRE